MLELTGINYFAVAVVWIIYLVIGSVWYSPAGFGKLWSRLSGVDMMKTPKRETTRAIVWVAVSCLVQVFVLALVLNSLHAVTAGEGLITALILWFGLTALTTVGNTLYQRQGWTFWWLNASYFLVVMGVGGIILGVWH